MPWESYNDNIKTVDIEYGVTSIGSGAFYGCNNLTSITIPDSVTSIGGEAFSNCESLASIEIPDNVTSIEWGSFEYCKSLTNIAIPDGVTNIGENAFRYCSGITSIEIPNGVTNIGENAFYQCSSLTKINIPDSVISIGVGAFSGTNLENLTIDENNNYYSSIDGVLFSKDKTELIQYPAGNTRTNYSIPDSVTSIWKNAFSNCSNLTSVEIPGSVTIIGNYAFFGCGSLTSINISDSVTNIGEATFYGCSSLTSITIPDSVTSISDSAFYGCSSLTSITIPNSVTSIEEGAFCECSSLTSIKIPDSVTSIGEATFYGCSSLTNIEIPDSVTSIGSLAFLECSSLTSIEIPSSVTNIEMGTFGFCSNLTSITIPYSVTSIGASAFAACESLTSIVIPNSVTNISEYAFAECSSLTDVYYTGTQEEWDAISIGEENEPLLNATIHFSEHRHSWETVVNPSSCIAQGESYEICVECEEIQNHTVLPLAGHTFGEWTVTTEATYTASGEKVRACEVCKIEETQEIPMLIPEYTAENENTGICVSYPNGTYSEEIRVEVTEEYDGEAYMLLNQEKGNFKNTLFDVNITLNGEKVQPNGLVLVRIPLPAGYNPENTVVYYVPDDSGLVQMNSWVENGYICFETDHFSSYAIVDETPRSETNDCDHMCHKDGFVGFIWKIVQFFWKLFKMIPVCECGTAHY